MERSDPVDLVGTWNVTKSEYDGQARNDLDSMRFNRDGTGAIYTKLGAVHTYRWEINGDSIEFYHPETNERAGGALGVALTDSNAVLTSQFVTKDTIHHVRYEMSRVGQWSK
jgi:hypothetical protein